MPLIWFEIHSKVILNFGQSAIMDTQTKGCVTSYAYLDDFLIMGPIDSSVCLQNLDTITTVCQHLGIPLAFLEEDEGPSQSLTFLGIVLDIKTWRYAFPIKTVANP